MELEHVFEEKDLGVLIDTDLKFNEHINSKVKKANMMVGLIRRSFSFLDGALFKILFTTHVRPHLEYCQSVWSPHLKKDITIIENVQRRGTKLINGFKNLTYSERLTRLELPTLRFRRLRGDMIECFKHFNHYDKTSIPNTFKKKFRPGRKHQFELQRKFPKDGTRGVQSNSFYYRVETMWNNLPSEVVNAENINIFKNRLDDHWKDHPLRYDITNNQQ